MLAYVFWHRPAPQAEKGAYEEALLRFHRSLAHNPPSGFRGSASFAPAPVPWAAAADEGEAPAYEDWHLLDGWSSLGVIEEAAVSRGHASLHDAVARRCAWSAGAVYRLLEGRLEPAGARSAAWVAAAPGHGQPGLGDLLADGCEGERESLWRRSLALGPAPEYALLSGRPADEIQTGGGLSQGRLPEGWQARIQAKEAVEMAERVEDG